MIDNYLKIISNMSKDEMAQWLYSFLFISSIFIYLEVTLICSLRAFFKLKLKRPAPKMSKHFNRTFTGYDKKSQECWEFSHEYTAKVCLYVAIINALVYPLTLGLIYIINNTWVAMIVLIFMEATISFIYIISVEIKLRKVFDKNGVRIL